MNLIPYGVDSSGAPQPQGAIDLNNSSYPGMFGLTVINMLRTGSGVYVPQSGQVSGSGAYLVQQPLARLFWTYDTIANTPLDAVLAADATIRLTKQVRAANDATMNIAIANGTSGGVTAAPTSADTTAGSLTTRQVETATVAVTSVTAGNVTVTVTAAGMAGSPIVLSVAVANGDSAAAVAAKIRAALAANATINAFFYIDTNGYGSQVDSGSLDSSSYLWAQLGAVSDQPFTLTLLQAPTNDFSDWAKCLITQSQATLQNGDYRYLDKVVLAMKWVRAFLANTGTSPQAYVRAQLSLGGVQ